MQEKLRERDKEGSQFFGIQMLEMDVLDKEDKERKEIVPVFYCKDFPGLLDFIARNY